MSMTDLVSWDVKVQSLVEVCRGSTTNLEYTIRLWGGLQLQRFALYM